MNMAQLGKPLSLHHFSTTITAAAATTTTTARFTTRILSWRLGIESLNDLLVSTSVAMEAGEAQALRGGFLCIVLILLCMILERHIEEVVACAFWTPIGCPCTDQVVKLQ